MKLGQNNPNSQESGDLASESKSPSPQVAQANLAEDSDLSNRVLDSAEQNHPRYLSDLLTNGDLANVVRARVDRYKNLMAKLQKSRPNDPYENLDEIARDQLGTTNPNWQSQEPLTRGEKKLLQQFREQHQI